MSVSLDAAQRRQKWQQQVERGKLAEEVQEPMLLYLSEIRARYYRMLSEELLDDESLRKANAVLLVITCILNRVKTDINSGRIAEENLKEDNDNGDVQGV